MQCWSKRANYTDEVKVEALGITLYLLCEFLAAIPSYTFHITILFLVLSPNLAASMENLSQLLHNNLIDCSTTGVQGSVRISTRCIGCRSPRLFSNNFYLVLKCCILVKNETSKNLFRNRLMIKGALGTFKILSRGRSLQITKFGHNFGCT